MGRAEFERDLTKLINVNSMESASDTPDYILAAYLMRCLDAWNCTTADRDYWYRKPTSGGQVYIEVHKRVCPDCLSTGQVTVFQDGRMVAGHSTSSINCLRCKGTGKIPA